MLDLCRCLFNAFDVIKSKHFFISYHSNKITWAATIENTIDVEGNIMKNVYAKFQLHPL